MTQQDTLKIPHLIVRLRGKTLSNKLQNIASNKRKEQCRKVKCTKQKEHLPLNRAVKHDYRTLNNTYQQLENAIDTK